jgi:ankyrin repeat protein
LYHLFIPHNYGKGLILAHNSVKDYLVALPTVDGWFSFEEKLSHSIIAKTCLTYFTTIFSEREFDTEDEKKYPFARYSVRHWPYHVRKAEEAFTDADMMSMKAIFYEPLFSAWFTISEKGAWTRENGTVSPLYYVSLKGILPAVKLLLANTNVNIVGGRYGTSIQAAAAEGYQDIVETLIQAKADVNIVGGEYGIAIQAAAAGGHQNIVETLIQAKADVNIVEGEYGTAIQAAAAGGDQNMVETLIQARADVNIVGGMYGTAIQAAVARGHRNIVETLIQARADVNIVGGKYGTAIQAAAVMGYQDIVEMLIQAKVDVNIVEGVYGTAIQAAAGMGYQDIVEMLIQAKADVNIIGGMHGTAIQAAAAGGYRNIVETLIQAGADVNIVGGLYSTAIQAAAAGGYQNIVETLIQAKADVNVVGGIHGTAIQAATQYRRRGFRGLGSVPAIVEILVKAGANPNGAPNYTNRYYEPIKSPIRYSEDLGRSDIIRLLLDAGAEDDRYLDKEVVLTDLKNGSA